MIAKGYIILKGDVPLKADNSQSLFKVHGSSIHKWLNSYIGSKC